MIGLTTGLLTVTKKTTTKTPEGRFLWELSCECGGKAYRTMNNIRSCIKNNRQSSCGCAPVKPGLIHGMKGTTEYAIWSTMKSRCLNKNDKDYPRYAHLGLCDRWKSFENFYADMGTRPSGHQLDRIDNNKGYSPTNCRWASTVQQARNKSTAYIWFVNGKEFGSVQEVADQFNVELCTAYRWFVGHHDKRRQSFTPPKPGFKRTKRYDSSKVA